MFEVTGLQRLSLGPINLSLKAGEIVALRGASGSGKTLLMRALADLDPAEGRVSLDGIDRDSFSGPDWRQVVAWVPAEAGWWADHIGAHFDDWQKAQPFIEQTGLPSDCKDWAVSRASTGERQRLALSRALAQKPRVLLLDEPTSGLDSTSVTRVENMIANQASAGVAVLWTTHDHAQANRVADRILSLEGGQLTGEAA
jgi:putative ABC transport system ATP-binding protein